MNNRKHIISFRLTGKEAGCVDMASAGAGRSTGDWSRAVFLDMANLSVPAPAKPRRCPPRRLPTYDFKELSKISGHLGKLGSNINQLAKVANSIGKIPDTAILKIIHSEITTSKDAIKEALSGGSV
jgi:hypothetical protein